MTRDILLPLIRVGLFLSLSGVMFAQGLKLAVSEQWAFFKANPLLMLRSLVAVLVLVPLAALAIVLLLKPSPRIVVGLAILAASPAAPFQLLNIAKKGGSFVYLATLHLTLALLAVITVPTVLYLLSTALGFDVDFGFLRVAETVGETIILPVALGVAVRSFAPAFADRTGPLLGRVAEISLYVLLIPVLAKTLGLVLKMDLWSYLVMAVFIMVNLAIGHVLGPRDAQGRTTLAMESAARNFGLALTIAVLNFSQDKALPVLIPYILLFAVISTLYLAWRNPSAHKRRMVPAQQAVV